MVIIEEAVHKSWELEGNVSSRNFAAEVECRMGISQLDTIANILCVVVYFRYVLLSSTFGLQQWRKVEDEKILSRSVAQFPPPERPVHFCECKNSIT